MADFPGSTYIDRPEGKPDEKIGRLTDLFPVKDADAHLLLGGVTFEIDYCAIQPSEVDFDSYDDCIRTAEKEFSEGLLFVESFPIGTQYAALKCRPGFGFGTMSEYETRARARLNGGATTFVETKLEEYVLDGTNATVVTAGSDLKESIAALVSQDIDFPVLHISTENAVLLGSALDNIVEAGIAVAISPAYSSDTAFLTGPVHVWGGETVVSAPDMASNYVLALAERQYIMAVECKPFKVTLP